MSEYTLEIKQIVDYPRCRIYRQFVQALIADRSIRVSGGSGLFYFVVLCAYANFRTSYKRIDGISYTIYPRRMDHVCGGIVPVFPHTLPPPDLGRFGGTAKERAYQFSCSRTW